MHRSKTTQRALTESLSPFREQTSGHFPECVVCEPTPDFEHERILQRVMSNMFGKARHLEINGRYRVLDRLGAGGMGEVYLCEDLELERQVAVKRVRGQGTDSDQRRLQQEARAQARLSHPNVVQIYDTGTHENCTFLAMEYVEGQTLAAWLAEGARPPAEILAHYIAAGRGLAAAHRAGIVHRDFKPDNVLIGADGTVRVADFGLALASRSDPATEEGQGSAPRPLEPASAVSGGGRGTIRYMSLEALQGHEVDARSDQFSFCLALYEALWGEPPFCEDSVVARRLALETAEPRAVESLASVGKIVRRGLSRDVEDRWPDMEALLDALERLPRRRRWIVASLAAAAIFAFGLGTMELMRSDPCAAAARDLFGVWNSARSDALERRFGSFEVGHAGESWRRVEAGLDRWAEAWTEASSGLCHAREAFPTEPIRLQTHDRCLSRQLREVEDFVTELAAADNFVLAEAVAAVVRLPAPADCEAEFAMSDFAPPDPAQADAVEAVRLELGKVRELRRIGRIAEALTLASEADHAASTLGYGPLQAEARAGLAQSEDVAGSPVRSSALYQEAIELAMVHDHDRLLPSLWTERAELSLSDLAEPERGAWFLRQAKVTHEHNDDLDGPARARLAFNEGRIAELANDEVAAEAAYRRAVEQATGSGKLDRPVYLDALARQVGPREAWKLRTQALMLAYELYGPKHPRTAKRAYNSGVMLHEAGKGGRELLELAAGIWREHHSRFHPDLGQAEFTLGVLALERNELSLAHAQALRAARVYRQTLEPEDPRHGEPHQLLAKVAGMRGDREEALRQAELAARAFEHSRHGARDQRALQMRSEIANQLMELGGLEQAQVELDGILDRVGEHEGLEVVARLLSIELSLRRGQAERAETQLRALVLLDLDAHLGARRVDYDLLRSIVDLRSGRASSLGAERARELGVAVGVEVLDAWLESLGVGENERRELGFLPRSKK